MPALKQTVELFDVFNVDNNATVRFKIVEPNGRVTYVDNIRDAMRAGRAIKGTRAYFETTIELIER
jgi:hypothetical protein